jgi:hypothetical protein
MGWVAGYPRRNLEVKPRQELVQACVSEIRVEVRNWRRRVGKMLKLLASWMAMLALASAELTQKTSLTLVSQVCGGRTLSSAGYPPPQR